MAGYQHAGPAKGECYGMRFMNTPTVEPQEPKELGAGNEPPAQERVGESRGSPLKDHD